jgi:hypothetical protein
MKPEIDYPAIRAAGVRVKQHLSEDEFFGTKAELIAAGIASDGQFPGDPDCGKTSQGFNADGSRLIG